MHWFRALVTVAFAITLLGAGSAFACGGFFCNNSQPVDQSGERILFSVVGETVTAHIQIAYQGDAEKFSWVLPLPSEPSSIGIGTDLLFSRLRQVTDPRFEIEWKSTDSCKYQDNCPCLEATMDADGGPPSDKGGGVDVIQQGEVGPFDYKVLKADTGQVLFDWLNGHGYDQPPEAAELIAHYVNLKFVFVVLKLLKNKKAGDLQPLVLRYSAPDLACIPIKLTSIAATPNMPVWSWVLGKARAVPINFFHVLLNPKAYDWLKCAVPTGGGGCGWWGWGGNNDCQNAYIDLVTKAVDTANGHAFVTEYAGSTEAMKDQIYKPGQFDYLNGFKNQKSPVQFIQKLFQKGFPNSPLFREIVKTHIPIPDNAGPECDEDIEFYNWNMEECMNKMPAGWMFDAAALVDELIERIVEPMKAAQELFTLYPYMTRMFTTLSPDEMSKDPLFSFNPDLPDVANVHKVTATPICKEGSDTEVESVLLTFPGGGTQQVEGKAKQCEGFVATDSNVTGGQPPATAIQIMGESGQPKDVDPNEVDHLEAKLDLKVPDPAASELEQTPDASNQVPTDGTFGLGTAGDTKPGDTPDKPDKDNVDKKDPTDPGPFGDKPAPSAKSDSSGCTAGPGPTSSGLLLGLLCLCLLAGVRRRREGRVS